MPNESLCANISGSSRVVNEYHGINIVSRPEFDSGPRTPSILGGKLTHLRMKGVGATRAVVGSHLIESFTITRGTAMIAIPPSTSNSIEEVSIKHLRPYIPVLDGTP